MEVFFVLKNGVYRHECGGIYSTLEKANAAAVYLIKQEPDSYHDYIVIPVEIDKVPIITSTVGFMMFIEERERASLVEKKEKLIFINGEEYAD